MITKRIPKFSFEEPKTFQIETSFDTINVRVGERRLRALWTPELAQDLHAFHNLDTEAELTALLTQNIAAEIDRDIINQLVANQNNRVYGNLDHPFDFTFPTFPAIRRVFANTIGNDLVAVQPLGMPMGQLNYIDYTWNEEPDENIIILPNEDGYYTDGTFESILITTHMKPFLFVPRRRRRRGIPNI